MPDHRFSLDAALSGYTLGGARAEGTDGDKGSLTQGKLADIVVLSTACDHEESVHQSRLETEIREDAVNSLPECSVRITMAGGRIVHEAGNG